MKNFINFGNRARLTVASGYGVIRNLHAASEKKFVSAKLPQKFRPFLEDYFSTELANDDSFYFPPSKIHIEKFGDEMVKFLTNLYQKENCADSHQLFHAANLFVKKEAKAVLISNLGNPLRLIDYGMWVAFDPQLNIAKSSAENLQQVQDNIHAYLILMAYANRFLGHKIFQYNSQNLELSFAFTEGQTKQRPHKDGIELCGIERIEKSDAFVILANKAAGDVATYAISDEEIYAVATEKLSAKTLEILQKPYFYYCQEDDHHMHGVHMWPAKKYAMISFQEGKAKIGDFNGDVFEKGYFHFDDPTARTTADEAHQALKEFINLVEELSVKPQTTKIFLKTDDEDRQAAIMHHFVHGRTVPENFAPQERSLIVTGLSRDPSVSISNPISSSLDISKRESSK